MVEPLKISNQVLFSAIKSSSWFKDVPDDVISWLSMHAKVNQYNESEVIYLSGENQINIYGILDGGINLSLVGYGGQHFSIMRFHKGFWFGESALISSQSKLLEVTTLEDSNIIIMPAQEVRTIADQYPIIYKNLYLDKMRQSQIIYDIFTSVLTYPLKARISLRLLTILDERGLDSQNGKFLAPAVSIAELAQLAMGSEQRVKMIVNEWVESGYIIVDNDMWIIPDVFIFEAEAVK